MGSDAHTERARASKRGSKVAPALRAMGLWPVARPPKWRHAAGASTRVWRHPDHMQHPAAASAALWDASSASRGG